MGTFDDTEREIYGLKGCLKVRVSHMREVEDGVNTSWQDLATGLTHTHIHFYQLLGTQLLLFEAKCSVRHKSRSKHSQHLSADVHLFTIVMLQMQHQLCESVVHNAGWGVTASS